MSTNFTTGTLPDKASKADFYNLVTSAEPLPPLITDLTAQSDAVAPATDKLMLYDASALALKAVTPDKILACGAAASVASVTSVGAITSTGGDITAASGGVVAATNVVAAAAVFAGTTLRAGGATTLLGTLAVTGEATFAADLTAAGGLEAGTNVVAAGALYAGTTLHAGGAATLQGTLGVTGAATLSSTLAVTGAATFSAAATFAGSVTMPIATAPANAGATGAAGEIRLTADHIYVCVATNTWKRAALSTWT